MFEMARVLAMLLMFSSIMHGQVYVNPPFVQYVSQCQTEEGRIDSSLQMVRLLYPDWESTHTDGVFDCGEMSSFVRWHLANCGIETHYIVGMTNGSDGKGGHIWLKTNSGLWIEPTTLSVVDMGKGTKLYTDSLYNITDITDEQAMKFYSDEMDWWATMPNIQKMPK